MGDAQAEYEVIKAERERLVEEAKAAGKRVNGVKKGELTKKLEAAYEAEISRLWDLLHAKGAEAVTISSSPQTTASYLPSVGLDFGGTPDFESEEWKFIQRCVAELDVNFQSSIQTKQVYHSLVAKVKNWRIAHRIVEQLGVGATWPLFTALGIKDNSGDPIHEHSVLSDVWIPGWVPPSPEPEEPEPELPPIGAPVAETPPLVTEGGMPLIPGLAPPDASDLAAAVAGDVLAQITSRPTPPREAPPE